MKKNYLQPTQPPKSSTAENYLQPTQLASLSSQSHETVETATKPPRNRDETLEENHETEHFFNKKTYFFFMLKKYSVSWFSSGVSSRFRGGFDGFVALRCVGAYSDRGKPRTPPRKARMGATEPNIFPGTMGGNVRMLHGASAAICGQPRAPKTMLICRPGRRKLRTRWSPKPTLFQKAPAFGS